MIMMILTAMKKMNEVVMIGDGNECRGYNLRDWIDKIIITVNIIDAKCFIIFFLYYLSTFYFFVSGNPRRVCCWNNLVLYIIFFHRVAGKE